MSSVTDPRVVAFPQSPHQVGPDDLWGGSGGPVMDDVPDGTPSEVKKRLSQILVQGAQTVLAALQYRVLPQSPTGSVERPGTLTPGITQTVGGDTSSIPTIRITGTGRQYTTAGLWALAGVGALVIFAVVRRR